MTELDADIWRLANALIDRHGNGAALWVAQRVTALLKEGDPVEAMFWTRVHQVIEELQRGRRDGEPIT
jgi:hypothetical protein